MLAVVKINENRLVEFIGWGNPDYRSVGDILPNSRFVIEVSEDELLSSQAYKSMLTEDNHIITANDNMGIDEMLDYCKKINQGIPSKIVYDMIRSKLSSASKKEV